MRNREKHISEDANVDMTPMLDIVFIMLIFFIVSSTFIREQGIDMTEHKNDENIEKKTKKAKAIIIRICADQRIIVDSRSIDIRSVRANVERKLAEDSHAVVIIESEKQATTGILVSVMDQARAARANISVSPLPISCNSQQIVSNMSLATGIS